MTTSDTRDGIRRRGKSWTALWWAPGPDGTPRQRSKGGFPTRKAAANHRAAQLAGLADGSYQELADKTITVGRYLIDLWLPSVRSGESRRRTTVASYEVAVESWIVPYLGGIRLVALTPRHIEQMITTLRTTGGKRGQGLSARSTQYAYTVLRMALAHARGRGYLHRNPAALVDRPGNQSREMTAWTSAQAQAFLHHVEGDRLYAAWVLFLGRGPRRGEVAGLRWRDVDLDAGTLRITHTLLSVGGKVTESTPKTSAGRRVLHLAAGLVAVLRRHRAAQAAERLAAGSAWVVDSGYVFSREDGSPLHPETLSDRFERLAKAAGVPVVRLHDLRHTAASLMLAGGVPVKVASEMLGHSNPSITMEIYQHVHPGMARDAGCPLRLARHHSRLIPVIAGERLRRRTDDQARHSGQAPRGVGEGGRHPPSGGGVPRATH